MKQEFTGAMDHAKLMWQAVRAGEQEERDTRLAVMLSLEASAADQQKAKQSLAILGPRLQEIGLERIDTPAVGNCQFDAVCTTLRLDINPAQLRQQVSQALKGI